MTNGVFDGVWRYGRRLLAFDESSAGGREFYGFLDPMSLSSVVSETRNKAGLVPTEEFRLIVEPAETFAYGTATTIVCGNIRFELLNVREVYDGEKISHRECVLLKVGEVEKDA